MIHRTRTAMYKEVGISGDDESYELFFFTATRVARLVVWLENNENSKSATFCDIGPIQEFYY